MFLEELAGVLAEPLKQFGELAGFRRVSADFEDALLFAGGNGVSNLRDRDSGN